MKHRQFRVVILVFVVLAVLAASFFAGRAVAGRRVLQAQEEGVPAAPADPNFSSFYCPDINNVASFDNRIHVRCSSANTVGTDSVKYYAYPTTSSSGYTANRMLAVGQTAYALARPAWIYYQASSSYNPPGCNTGDCRLIVGLSIVE